MHGEEKLLYEMFVQRVTRRAIAFHTHVYVTYIGVASRCICRPTEAGIHDLLPVRSLTVPVQRGGSSFRTCF